MCKDIIISHITLLSKDYSKTSIFLKIVSLTFRKPILKLWIILFFIFGNIHLMFAKILFSQLTCILRGSFLYYQERRYFFFPKIWILFFRRKMKDDLSQKTHGNVIFSLYLVKVVLLFPINMILTFYYPIKKAKIIFLKKKN